MGLRICSACASLPERQARHFFRHLLAALRHAHARGFLHCDVKPANVRLQLGPREGELTAVLVRVTHAHACTCTCTCTCMCTHAHMHLRCTNVAAMLDDSTRADIMYLRIRC